MGWASALYDFVATPINYVTDSYSEWLNGRARADAEEGIRKAAGNNSYLADQEIAQFRREVATLNSQQEAEKQVARQKIRENADSTGTGFGVLLFMAATAATVYFSWQFLKVAKKGRR